MTTSSDRLIMIDELIRYCVENKIVNKNNKLKPINAKNQHLLAPLQKAFPNMPNRVIIDVIFNHNGIPPKCIHCGNDLDYHNLSNQRKLTYMHPECVSESRKSKISWAESIKKRKKTNLQRYGTEAPFDYEKNVLRSRETKLKRYGTENYVNPKKCKQTKLDRYGDPNYRNDEKIRQTNLQRYGHENVFGNREIIEKSSETLCEKYGGRGFSSPETSAKIAETNIERCGYHNAMMCEEIKEKSRVNGMKSYHTADNFLKLTANLPDLYHQYEKTPNLSVSKIANEMNISKKTLLYRFHVNGLKILEKSFSNNTSKAEEKIIEMIEKIAPDVEIIRNDRKTIYPKEIDIFLPELKLGVEHHGAFWHKESRVGDLHREKYKLARDKGIRLIQVFDFELRDNAEMLFDLIKSALNKNKKVYARYCALAEVTSTEEKEFLRENHLQGYVPSKKCYGLYHKGELVSIMSFGIPRFTKSYQWEILRFCNKRGITVTGGATKLWSNFVQKESIENCVTYCDPRFFDGRIYQSMGFKFIDHSQSGYFWYNGRDVLKRYTTQKHKLVEAGFDSSMTESEIMTSLGYYKVLDAGMLKFSFTNTEIQ